MGECLFSTTRFTSTVSVALSCFSFSFCFFSSKGKIISEKNTFLELLLKIFSVVHFVVVRPCQGLLTIQTPIFFPSFYASDVLWGDNSMVGRTPMSKKRLPMEIFSQFIKTVQYGNTLFQ